MTTTLVNKRAPGFEPNPAFTHLPLSRGIQAERKSHWTN